MECRPTDGWSSGGSGSEEGEEEGSEDGDEGDEGEDEEGARERMLAALEAHQAAFMKDAAPKLAVKGRADKGKAVAAKPIWEMEMDDFQEDDDEDEDEESDDEDEQGRHRHRPAFKRILPRDKTSDSPIY